MDRERTQLDRRPADAGAERLTAVSVNWRDVLTQRLEKARLRRRIYQELMAYSDRELNELGLGRRDISEIARAA
jgi:hypothetical protein